jgi:hypothetical protein
MGQVALNDREHVDDEMESWKGVGHQPSMPCFKVLLHNFSVETEENHKPSQSV